MTLSAAEIEALRNGCDPGPLADALSPALHHLLPGGALFADLHLADHDRTRTALARFEDAARAAPGDETARAGVREALFGYLNAVEKRVHDIDLGRLDHQKLLMTLRLLLPPPRLSRPLVFVIAGPSGSGKDTVMRGVIEALQARGYPAAFLTKYINRRGRPSETSMHPFLRYQMPVTEGEFAQLAESGEVMFGYEIYGNYYGFSRTALHQLLRPVTGHAIVFIVMSQYAQMDRLCGELLAENPKALVSPVLVYADLDTCLDRLAQRLSGRPFRTHEVFLAAKREYDRRAEQIEEDIKKFGSDDAFARYYHVRNDKPDGGLSAMNRLYRFVAAKVADTS